MTLVGLRRAHHLFPIRPYLLQLVVSLEDTDGNVRECARQSVVKLFTGPGVTDAARADLKKEMVKKGVRKNIVDNVLSKLIAGGGVGSGPQSEGSDNGDAGPVGKKDYIPPSLMLAGRKPTDDPGINTGPGGMSRTTSTKEISRPASRSAMVSPTGLQSPTVESSAAEVQPVYVSHRSFELPNKLTD